MLILNQFEIGLQSEGTKRRHLEWPASDPANAEVSDEFRLNTFPPSGGTTPPA